MLNIDQRASTSRDQDEDDDQEEYSRDIHALTPPPRLPLPPNRTPPRRREAWETNSSHRSSSLSMASSEIGGAPSETFTTLSREFNVLVLAGSTAIGSDGSETDGTGSNNNNNNNNLGRIGEEEFIGVETNPLAIVPDNSPMDHPPRSSPPRQGTGGNQHSELSVQRVKKEEVESKISAWQNAKVAKLNNRFKREDAIINGWESEQLQKSTCWMKKVERKLEVKRARAMEKMQNDIAKAQRKAEEKRATAEAKRGTKVARVIEIANLMRAVGRPPAKRSFF